MRIPRIITSCIPHVRQFRESLGLTPIDYLKQILIHFFAILKTVWRNLQGTVQDILLLSHQIHQIRQCGGRMLGSIHMDMNTAGLIHECPCMPKLSHYLLQICNIRIGENWAHHLAGITAPCDDLAPTDGLLLAGDGCVRNSLPRSRVIPVISISIPNCCVLI